MVNKGRSRKAVLLVFGRSLNSSQKLLAFKGKAYP
jgi:hypothetical protein